MVRPRLEVADIFRQYGEAYRLTHGASLSPEQHRAMRAVEACRTAALGGHVEGCDQCGHQVIAYNSCRNRHCPKCQSLATAQWLAEREAEVLPVEYFHVVFTVPAEIGPIALQNQRVVYDILFGAASETLARIAADPRHLGAEIGFLAVLHTWGQNLSHHPHVHCVVPGGGLSPDGLRFVTCRPGFLLPVKVLSRLYRRLFLKTLGRAFARRELTFHGCLTHLNEPTAFARLVRQVGCQEWVVYAKRPFGGPVQVLSYLGRYTHRVALSNDRLIRLEDGQVTFRWKDYRRGNRQRTMTLAAPEFIRRFLLHVLPKGFRRIRQYGFLSNRSRGAKLARCRQLLGAKPQPAAPVAAMADYLSQYEAVTGLSLVNCPACQRGRMRRIAELAPGGGGVIQPPQISWHARLDSS